MHLVIQFYAFWTLLASVCQIRGDVSDCKSDVCPLTAAHYPAPMAVVPQI